MKKFLAVAVLFMSVQAWGFSWKEVLEEAYDSANRALKINLSTDMAGSQKTVLTPICSTRTTTVLDIYVVGGSTTATATFQVFVDSAALVTTDGLYPGTTYWMFEYANQDTLGEAVTYWNAAAVTTPGIEGGAVFVLRQGAYDGNLSSSMTVRAAVTVHTSTNTTIFYTDAIIGMTYTIAAPASGSNYITGGEANVTFSTGSVFLNVYDGTTATTSALLHRQEVEASATGEDFSLGKTADDYIFGTTATATRIDVVSEDGIPLTAGQMNIRGFIK